MYNDQYLIPEWRTSECVGGREGVGKGVLRLGDNKRVVVLAANLAESTRVALFGQKYPERFLDVGVAEQNLVGVAAGMALEGMIPYATSYAVFLTGRAYDQIRVSVALSRANVKLIGAHGGVATGVYGPSHQSTEDVGMMRMLPNMTVLTPADTNQTEEAMVAAASYEGPVYIRTTRPEAPNFTKLQKFEIGKIYKYREGSDVTIVTYGIQVWDALMVAEQLAREGVECEVLNASTIKPFDTETLVASAKKTGKVVTIEDHQIAGGLGGVVSETLSENCPVPLKRIGVNDRFGVSAPWAELYVKFGLDQKSLYEQIKHVVA